MVLCVNRLRTIMLAVKIYRVYRDLASGQVWRACHGPHSWERRRGLRCLEFSNSDLDNKQPPSKATVRAIINVQKPRPNRLWSVLGMREDDSITDEKYKIKLQINGGGRVVTETAKNDRTFKLSAMPVTT